MVRVGAGQRLAQFVARADPELGEDPAQMPLRGTGTDEKEPRADLRVRESVPGQLSDRPFVRGEVVAGLGRSLARPLAGGHELLARAFGEGLHADGREQIVCGTQSGTSIDAPPLTPQPLAVASRPRNAASAIRDARKRTRAADLAQCCLLGRRPRLSDAEMALVPKPDSSVTLQRTLTDRASGEGRPCVGAGTNLGAAPRPPAAEVTPR